MAKRRAGKQRASNRGQRRKVALLAFFLVAVLVGGALAQFGGFLPAQKKVRQTANLQVQPASLSPGGPSKEYIYAGGRLVATEEPSATCTAPAAPATLSATSGNTQVTLSWSAVTGANSYNLKRSTASGGPYTTVASGLTGTTYTDTGLTNGTLYYYVVSAQSGACESSNSPQTSATPTGGGGGTDGATYVSQQSVPTAMTAGQTAAVSITMSNSGTTTWSPGAYVLGSQNPQGNTTWGMSQVVLQTNVSPTSQVTFSFNITAPATAGTYNFQWQMTHSGVYFGGLSPNVAISVTGGGGSGLPAAPTSLTTSLYTSTTIKLQWADNSTNETGFQIDRKVGTDSSAQFTQIAQVGVGATSYFDKNLPAGTYTYRVRAYNGSGNSAYSNESAPLTINGTAPAAPGGLTATASGSSQVNLSWTDNSNNEDGFKIELLVGSSFTQIAAVGAGVTTYSDTGRSPSTTYTYRVKAYNGSGDSAYSNQASATTGPPPPPTAPSDLTAAAAPEGTQVNLTWLDNSNNEESFKIERKLGTGSYAEIASVAANTTSYSDTTAPSTDYGYRVRAYNSAGGYSAYTNEVPVTTPAAENLLLADDFNDNALDAAKWSVSILSGTQDTAIPVSESSQQLRIGPLLQNTATSHYNGVLSVNTYDLTSGYAYVQAVAPPPANTTVDLMFTLPADDSNHYRMFVEAGVLKFEKKLNGTKVALGNGIPFDPVAHAFWRIRHNAAADQIIFETAPLSNGVPGTWTAQTTITRDVTITAVHVELKAGTYQAEANAPGTLVFDNVRVAKPAPANPAPSVTAISPSTGGAGGGTSVTLTGTGFAAGATVSLGGAPATSVTVVNSNSITATTAAHAAGTVNVVVTNSDGQSGTLANGFTYGSAPAPTVTAISPTSGPTTGGTAVTITGTGFASGATVSIGTVAATNVTVVSATSITATTGVNVAGVADVVVINPDNQTGTLAGAFTYTPAETVLLADDFNAASLDTGKWANTILSGTQDTAIGLTQSAGWLQIGPLLQSTATSHYNGISSVAPYNFSQDGAYAYVQLAQAVSASTTADAMFTLVVDISNQYRVYIEAGVLKFEKKLNGTKTLLGSVTFDPVAHAFWRLRRPRPDGLRDGAEQRRGAGHLDRAAGGHARC